MPSPSIVFVPGSFAQPELYSGVLEPLAAKGYDVHAVSLRTALPKDANSPGRPLPTMDDDATMIATKIEELAEIGKDVVVFAHSYGGTPASQSVRGLGKAERQKQGKQGGVVHLAYITCLVGEVGQAAGELLKSKTEDKLPADLNEDGWMSYTEMEAVARISFSGIPHDQALVWAGRLGWHSSVSFGNPLQYAGYKDIPASWLLCEHDLAIPKSYQQTAINMIESKSGRKVDVTSIGTGHVPMIAGRDDVIGWMMRIVGAASATTEL